MHHLYYALWDWFASILVQTDMEKLVLAWMRPCDNPAAVAGSRSDSAKDRTADAAWVATTTRCSKIVTAEQRGYTDALPAKPER
jgi:hypothetical protein